MAFGQRYEVMEELTLPIDEFDGAVQCVRGWQSTTGLPSKISPAVEYALAPLDPATGILASCEEGLGTKS